MRVVYVGSLPAVVIPVLRDLEVVRGEPVDLPGDVALSLLEQSTWQEAPAEEEAEEPAAGGRRRRAQSIEE
jgi:hypothetical protein